jgi:hypothetical protein
MSYAVRSTIDVALWFHDKAEATRTRLPAQTLQRLLLLAQARYRPIGLEIALMPAVFVPSSMGPVEPNIYTLFEGGIPTITRLPLAERVTAHLQSIWQVFGVMDPDGLRQAINADLACMRLVAANDSPVPGREPEGARPMTTKSTPANTDTAHRKAPEVTEPVVIKAKSSKSGKAADKIGSALGDLVQSLQSEQAAKAKPATKPAEARKEPKKVQKWRPTKRVR